MDSQPGHGQTTACSGTQLYAAHVTVSATAGWVQLLRCDKGLAAATTHHCCTSSRSHEHRRSLTRQVRLVRHDSTASGAAAGPAQLCHADEGGLQSLLEKQDTHVRRFVLILVFGMMLVAAGRVFPTMGVYRLQLPHCAVMVLVTSSQLSHLCSAAQCPRDHRIPRSTRPSLAGKFPRRVPGQCLTAPRAAEPRHVCVAQMQGVKSTQWVAKNADKALELLSGGAAGHLISMLSDQTQPGEHGEAKSNDCWALCGSNACC